MPGDVTLAYRLLGMKGPAESAGLTPAILFIVLGLMGITNLIVFPHSSGAIIPLSCLGIIAGVLSAYRLIGIFRAKHLLNSWEPSQPP